ncbi:MAG: glycosyltransferase family 39 protein [Bacteroidales bacterium]|nr:glycosyltransferase family 39 protein [Bacteroidales bacterium]
MIQKAGQKKPGWSNLPERKLRKWFHLSIILAVAAAWLPSLWYTFSPMDDYWLIVTRMDFLSDPANLPALFSQSMTEVGYSANYYRPLLNLSFMIEASVSGGSAWVFHLGNLIIHGLNVFLVYRILRGLSIPLWVSMAGSLLFCIHPVNAQAVAWIPGRSDTLMATFFFASMLFFIRYLKHGSGYEFGFSLFFFMGALLTKETAIAMPVVAGACYLALRGNLRKYREWLAILAGFIAVLIVWYLIRSSVIESVDGARGSISGSLIRDLLPGIFAFTGKLFLTVQNPLMPFSNTTTVAIGVAVAVILIMMVVKFRVAARGNALFGIAWAFVFILPPLLVKGGANEHWMYSSIPGFIIFLSSVDFRSVRAGKKTQLSVFLFVTACFLTASHIRADVYRNYDTFLNAAIKAKPSFAMYYDMRGALNKSKGNFNGAVADYSKAIELNPKKVTFYLRRATLYASMNMKKEAYNDFSKIIEIDSSQTTAWFMRANILGEMKNYQAALQDYNRYIELVMAELGITEITGLMNRPTTGIPENLPLAVNNSAIYYYYTGDYEASGKMAMVARSLGVQVSPSFLDSLRVKLKSAGILK